MFSRITILNENDQNDYKQTEMYMYLYIFIQLRTCSVQLNYERARVCGFDQSDVVDVMVFSVAAMAKAPASLGGGGSHESGGDQSPRSNVREQDRYLPIANISRIMKKASSSNLSFV